MNEIVNLAVKQLGIKEQTGHNDGQSIFAFTGGREEPWCAHFVAWVYRTVGKPIPGDIVPTTQKANPLASVSHMESIFNDHGWHYREPKPGDVVFFIGRGKSDRGPGRHCGIVESVDSATATFTTIEGNLSNAVRRSRYNFDDMKITGFGRLP